MVIVNATLQYLKVSDGNRLYYQKWMPRDPKAIIVFVHGLAEHVGRYNHFRQYFACRGYGVCLFDLRGHGNSGGRRTHVNRFYDYLYDASQFIEFVRKSSPPAPIFLVGHSFGGQVVLNFIVRYAKGIRGVVVLSPHIEHKLELPGWKVKIGSLGAKIFPVLRVGCSIDPVYLSHDPAVVEEYKRDTNIMKSITLKCGWEILRNSELVMALAGRIHLPIFLMHGGDDRICSPEATQKFYARVPVYNKQLKIYPGMYHELLNEKGKEEVFSDMEGWFGQQLDVELRLAGAAGRKGG